MAPLGAPQLRLWFGGDSSGGGGGDVGFGEKVRIEQRFVNLGLGLRRIYSVWLERKMVSLGNEKKGVSLRFVGLRT